MKALSLFSGIGGLDLAAEVAGIETVAMCEKEPFCRKVLAKHWPGVPIFEDIFALRGDDIGASIDVIHGGFPCQPFSVAGRQGGQSDDRYLWPEFSRLVGELKPRWVVAENVPGILRIAADDVCQDLERQGYSVGIWNFEAAAVGSIHRRARVFFVGHSECGRLPREPRWRTGEKLEDGRQDVSDAEGDGRGPRRAESEGLIRETRALRGGDYVSNAPPVLRESIERCKQDGNVRGIQTAPHADSARREEQRSSVAGEKEQRPSERGGGRTPEPNLGRIPYGIPLGLDGLAVEPNIPRVATGVIDRVARLRALGNAVVPAQAYPVFRAIAMCEAASGDVLEEVA